LQWKTPPRQILSVTAQKSQICHFSVNLWELLWIYEKNIVQQIILVSVIIKDFVWNIYTNIWFVFWWLLSVFYYTMYNM